VVLRLEPADGVELVEAYGYTLRANTIEVADLGAGEVRTVVVKIKKRSSTNGATPVTNVTLSMTNPETGEKSEQRATASVEITDDHQAVLRGQSAAAVSAVERAQTARALQAATEMYERGDAAGARRVLDVRREQAKKRAAAIDAPELASEIDEVAEEAEKNFAPPSPASSEGKAGRKRNRKKAYDLLY
jgi:hypothetical protein